MPRVERQEDIPEVHRAHADTLDRIERNAARLHGEVQSAARARGSPPTEGRTAEGTQMHPGLYPTGHVGETRARYDDAIYHPYGTQGHLAEVEAPHVERPEQAFGAQGRGRNMAPYTAAGLERGAQGGTVPVRTGTPSVQRPPSGPTHQRQQPRPHEAQARGQTPFLHTHAGASPPMSLVGLPRLAEELRAMDPIERTPPLTIMERETEFKVEAELPGVKEEDLDVEAYEDWIDIVAEARPGDGEGRVIVSDRRPVLYQTRIALPAGIKPSEVKATLKEGVLELTLPKKKGGGGRHRVQVE